MLDKVDSSLPYAINSYEQRGPMRANGKEIFRQRGTAMWFTSPKCRVPCTHYSNWYGYAIFSYGAMRKMEEYVKNNELINVCKIWDTTHDVGLGIFVWELAIPFLPSKLRVS